MKGEWVMSWWRESEGWGGSYSLPNGSTVKVGLGDLLQIRNPLRKGRKSVASEAPSPTF